MKKQQFYVTAKSNLSGWEEILLEFEFERDLSEAEMLEKIRNSLSNIAVIKKIKKK